MRTSLVGCHIKIPKRHRNTPQNAALVNNDIIVAPSMEEQPYQIQMSDYPKLFRYRVTQQGFYHIEELVSKIYLEEEHASMYTLVKLGILLRVNMCQTQNLQNESLFQDISNRAKKFGGVEPQYIHECVKSLIARGLLESNPKYDQGLAMQLHLRGLNSI